MITEHAGLSRPGFSSDFVDWASRAGYGVFADNNAFGIANNGGEIRYYIREDSGWLTLAEEERALPATLIMRASHLPPIERLLAFTIGSSYRSRRGLGMILLPLPEDGLADNYDFVDLDGPWTALARDGKQLRDVQFPDSRRDYEASEYPYYAAANMGDIRRSMESPSGAPLFEGFVSSAV